MSKQLVIKDCGSCPYRMSEWSGRNESYWIGMRCKFPGADEHINLDMHPTDTIHKDCPMDDYVDPRQFVAT